MAGPPRRVGHVGVCVIVLLLVGGAIGVAIGRAASPDIDVGDEAAPASTTTSVGDEMGRSDATSDTGSPSPDVPTPTSAATTTTTVPIPDGPTGVPDDAVLVASGPLVVSTPGAIVDGLDIGGTVEITASDVVLRRSRVQAAAYVVVRVADDVTGVVIEDVTVDGLGVDGMPNSMGIRGPATVRRTTVTGVENGIVPGSGSVIVDNLVHQLSAPDDPHYDGIQIDGGVADVRIEGNRIDMSEHPQTATVMINNYEGTVDDVTVTGNALLGGGYTVYSDAKFSGGPITDVVFSDNRITTGIWGPALIRDNEVVWSDNVDEFGAPVERAPGERAPGE